jgi:urea transport system permease protein
MPSAWTYFEGLLFVLPVAFLPGGLASLVGLLRRRRVAPGRAGS